MKSTVKSFAQSGRSNRVARMLTVTFAVCAISAIVPRLLSVTAAIPPTFTQTNLVSDVPGMAKITDSNLVNPWGMALGTNSGIWISDNGSGKATTYDGAGQPIPAGPPQIVPIPVRGKGGESAPTG